MAIANRHVGQNPRISSPVEHAPAADHYVISGSLGLRGQGQQEQQAQSVFHGFPEPSTGKRIWEANCLLR